MIPPNLEQQITLLIGGIDQYQTQSHPEFHLYDYATRFLQESSKDYTSRRWDGLNPIDKWVKQSIANKGNDLNLTMALAEKIVRETYKWIGNSKKKNLHTHSGGNVRGRRGTAVLDLLGYAFVWYKFCLESIQSIPRAKRLIEDKKDVPFNLFEYRFNRSRYVNSVVRDILYRGDTRHPRLVYEAGGFYGKEDKCRSMGYDPQFDNGHQIQMVSPSSHYEKLYGFTKPNRCYCIKSYKYKQLLSNGGERKVVGFAYEIDKRGKRAIESSAAAAGLEVVFLSVPNEYITRFKVSYDDGNMSPWYDYDTDAFDAINVVE